MLTRKPDIKMIVKWRKIWRENRAALRPNRKTGAELRAYLIEKYPCAPVRDERILRGVALTVTENAAFAEKLPIGAAPEPVAYFIKNEGAGRRLYEDREHVFRGVRILVGIDLTSGVFSVEGSGELWDELLAWQGLDEKDMENFFLVAQYVPAKRKNG